MKKLTSRVQNSLRKDRSAPSKASPVSSATPSNDGVTQDATIFGPSNLSDSSQAITQPITGTHPDANPLPSIDLVAASSASASTADLASNAPPLATSLEVASQPNPLPRTTTTVYILKKALERLDPEERATLQQYTSSSTADADTALNAAYEAARDKQAACRGTRFVLTLGKQSIELRDIANRVMKWLDRFKSVLDVAVSADPIHAALPWAGVRVLLEIATTEQKEMAALLSGLNVVLYNGSRMTVYFEFLADFPEGNARTNFEAALINLQMSMMSFLAKGISWSQKSLAKRSFAAFWGNRSISDFESKCGLIATQAEQEASICGRVLIADMSKTLSSLHTVNVSISARLAKDQLSKLVLVRGASFDSYQEEKKDERQCLQGTRENILERIRQWVDNPNDKSIFWLHGRAGTGKSTISRTVARHFNNKGQLGASFFFQRNGDRGTARWLFTTIAVQLSYYLPELVPFVAEAVENDPDMSERPPKDQFEKVILHPLSNVSKKVSTIVLVIDALDECDVNDIRVVVPLLAQVAEVETVRLRVFLTSRPETLIKNTFRAISNDRDHRLDEVTLEDIPNTKHDISSFLRDELSKTRKDGKELGPTWPGPEVIEELATMAEPLFIFAATICRFIQDENWLPTDQLDIIRTSGLESQASKLDQTYNPVFAQLLQGQDARQTEILKSQFREVIGTVTLLAEPLPVRALVDFLTISADVLNLRLERLHSVLSIPDNRELPVKMFHLSFREFLLDCEKKDRYWFWVNEEEAHGRIALRCLEIMLTQNSLKRDLCDLKEPGVARSKVDRKVVNDHLPAQVQYACQYWVHHVEKGKGSFHDVQIVLKLLRTHLLHWFEALSWMGRISEGVTMIITLRSFFDTYKNSELSDFLYDAYRFLLSCSSIADSSPLQLYCSALVFAPEKSIVRAEFEKCIPAWIQTKPKVQVDWGVALQTLVGHTNLISSVAFSPDGQRVVSGSWDKTVRLWDAVTGAVLQTLKGHTDSINSIAFSPDGQRVVSGSWDKTVRLWDAVTGASLQTLKDHISSVNSVAFSPDGQRVVSGSLDHTLRLWDAVTGKSLQNLKGHTSWVNSIAFSSDSQRVVSGSEDGTVRLWDAVTGELLQTLKGHTSPVYSVAFSPDGQRVVSGSWDETVRLWDTVIGAPLQKLEDTLNIIKAVAFSPDGQRVVSGSHDSTVRLWDAVTRAVLQTLKGHTDSVNSVAFSSDSQRVVSGSWDNTVRLWDAVTGELLQTLKGHTSWVYSVAFSPDGQRVVSGSEDKTVRLWDAVTGEILQTLKGHTSPVDSVAFSPDGQRVLSRGRWDKTVQLWDTVTGKTLQTLKGYTKWVASATFLPNSNITRTLFESNNWIVEGDSNLLWLPPNYRATCIAVWNRTIVLGHPSGRISILRFEEGSRLISE